MTPRKYTVALAVGAVTSRTAPADPRRTRTTATLLIENRGGWACIRVGFSRAREFPGPVASPFPRSIYYSNGAVIPRDSDWEPDNNPRIGRGENLQVAPRGWRLDAPQRTRRDLLAVVHRNRRRISSSWKNRVRNPPQPHCERVPGDGLPGESEGDERPWDPRVPERPRDSRPSGSRGHHGTRRGRTRSRRGLREEGSERARRDHCRLP